MKTKVLHIRGSLKISGAANVAMNYLRYIDREKFHVDYLVFDKEGEYESEVISLGGDVLRINGPEKGHLQYFKSIYYLLKEGNYDVVHSHTFYNSGLNLLAAYLNKVPVRISHSHTTGSNNPSSFLYKLYEMIMKIFIKVFGTDLIACTTKAGYSLYGKRKFDKDGIILNNGILIDDFEYNYNVRERMRKSLGYNDELVIGHIGRFSKEKNHDFIIRVFNKVLEYSPNSKLLLIGDGDLIEDIKSLSNELNISEYITFTGNRTDINHLMQVIDVIVLPSFYEGFPMVLVEAQTVGIPSVISDNITQSVDLTGSVSFLSLKESVNVWAKELIKYGDSSGKKCNNSLISNAGFDIKKIVKYLEGIYVGGK